MLFTRLACCLALLPFLGCALDPNAPALGLGEPDPTADASGAPEGPSGDHAPANPSAVPADPTLSVDPMLVTVDTDRKLSALPGDGLGIFIEYASGGQWHVWLTCDAHTSPTVPRWCTFDLDISSESDITNPLYDASGTNNAMSINSPDTKRFKAHMMTSDQAAGVTFSSDQGAVVRIAAKVDGRYVAPFFFIEDGVVNGSNTCPLTDPLLVRGSTP
jgi:hypothetical protein